MGVSTAVFVRSFLGHFPGELSEERFETLLSLPGLRVERIVSFGHATPPGEWYDQDDDEWVMLVQGAARLSVEDQAEELVLKPGDFVFLPARCRHRVEWTPSGEVTLWLAIHHSASVRPAGPSA